jgi:phosphatidylethanolamine-binding protein (PEBP) family uncharacterized protein
MGVDFEWQRIDFGSTENPKIRLTGVPEGTKRFFVGLVDLDISTYDHGGGFVDNDGAGLIARGSVKGNYNGPAPWLPDMIHDYEITVKAYDEDEKLIGMGKNVKKFTFGVVKQSGSTKENQ